MRGIMIGLLACVGLGGCASLSEDQCRGGNWQEIGSRDGAEGRTTDYLQNHVKACSEYGVTPDATAWQAGRQAGLALYCTPERAYREGRLGRDVRPVCPAGQAAALSQANEKGRTWHRIGEEISEVQRDIREAQRQGAAADTPEGQQAAMMQVGRLQMRLSMLRTRRMLYDSL